MGPPLSTPFLIAPFFSLWWLVTRRGKVLKHLKRGESVGPVVKNPPANARDVGSMFPSELVTAHLLKHVCNCVNKVY